MRVAAFFACGCAVVVDETTARAEWFSCNECGAEVVEIREVRE